MGPKFVRTNFKKSSKIFGHIPHAVCAAEDMTLRWRALIDRAAKGKDVGSIRISP